VDEADGHGVEEVALLPPLPPRDHEARLLELPQVLHHPEAAHLEATLEGAQALPVLPEQLVEQAPPGGIGQRPEHLVHAFGR
jgi:hypothetical protein